MIFMTAQASRPLRRRHDPEAPAYRESVRERFLNPFLDHRLSQIAAHHAPKKERRIGGLRKLAAEFAPRARAADPVGDRELRRRHAVKRFVGPTCLWSWSAASL